MTGEQARLSVVEQVALADGVEDEGPVTAWGSRPSTTCGEMGVLSERSCSASALRTSASIVSLVRRLSRAYDV